MHTALNTGYGAFMGAGGFGLEVRSETDQAGLKNLDSHQMQMASSVNIKTVTSAVETRQRHNKSMRKMIGRAIEREIVNEDTETPESVRK